MNRHDNDPSWGALAVAILFECPISPEEAINLYEDGSILFNGRKYKAETIIKSCRIKRLRSRGCAWWAISEMTGIVSPESYINMCKGLVSEVERRKKQFCISKKRKNGYLYSRATT
jgi:hypothetical protein